MLKRILFADKKNEKHEKQPLLLNQIANQSSFKKVPDPVINLIFSFVDLDSLLILMCISKQFHQIAAHQIINANQIENSKLSNENKDILLNVLNHFEKESERQPKRKSELALFNPENKLTTFGKLFFLLKAEQSSPEKIKAIKQSKLKRATSKILDNFCGTWSQLGIVGCEGTVGGVISGFLFAGSQNCVLFTCGTSLGTCLVCGVANCICKAGLEKCEQKFYARQYDEQNRHRRITAQIMQTQELVNPSERPPSITMTKK